MAGNEIAALLIAGPTASGKSLLALRVAERLGGVLINADSMQVYRDLRVMTARPSRSDEARVPHYLFGHADGNVNYSVGRYVEDAGRVLVQLRAEGRLPIFVGGTGLYFRALTDGLADMPSVPAGIRDAARARLAEIGNDAFHAELAARDPQMAAQLNPGDGQRMLRAFEVFAATGKSLAFWQQNEGKPVLDGLRVASFVIEVPREVLRTRIAARFRAMLAAGAMEEALALEDLDPALPAARIIGRRELLALHDGALDEEAAVERAVIATRQYAKRQDTWFRNQLPDWIRVDGTSNIVTEMQKSL